jgi:FAD:protein FMN transferase
VLGSAASTAQNAVVRAERRFAVMGSDAHVIVDAAHTAPLLKHAVERTAALEARWSRFVSTSELSTINSAPHRPVVVSDETLDLVRLALDAWRTTGGLFDPTVLGALESAGYRRSFLDGIFEPGGPIDVPGGNTIEVDDALGAVIAHAPIDLGGIGKGRAADLVATELVERGATRTIVNLGGDVRVAGSGEDARIGIEDPTSPRSGRVIDTVVLAAGAVATSSVMRRRWAGGHHIIDPRTGRPSDTDLVAVTVLAGTCAWAEVFAKACVIAGSTDALALLSEHRLTARLVFSDGRVERVGDASFVPVANPCGDAPRLS